MPVSLPQREYFKGAIKVKLMYVNLVAACGIGTMRQQVHLDHEEIIGLNICTNIDKEQFLSRT